MCCAALVLALRACVCTASWYGRTTIPIARHT
jgi:hypothetical protein